MNLGRRCCELSVSSPKKLETVHLLVSFPHNYPFNSAPDFDVIGGSDFSYPVKRKIKNVRAPSALSCSIREC